MLKISCNYVGKKRSFVDNTYNDVQVFQYQGGTFTSVSSWKYDNATDMIEEFSRLRPMVKFNGVSSKVKINTISLSKNGDSIEIEAIPDTNSEDFGLAQFDDYTTTIGLTRTKLSVRAADDTWLLFNKTITDREKHIVKIVFVEGNVQFFVDGVVVSTYIGQKEIKINQFGHAASVPSFYKGIVGYVSVNGIKYNNIRLLPGYQATDITMTSNGFLSEEEHARLMTNNDKALLKEIAENKVFNIYIHPSDNKVDVFFRIKDKHYGRLGIIHSINHTDNTGQNGYCDMWGLYDDGGLYTFDGANFTDLEKPIIIGAENEFAMLLEGMEDFTGGYHGDERIDLDPSCYVDFVADGKHYTIEELIKKGNLGCNSFYYLQKSQLFASYKYDTSHKLIGEHVKKTSFVKGGYETENYAKFNLSSLSVSQLSVVTAFTGLVCPHKNFTGTIICNNGEKLKATNPTATVVLKHFKDVADSQTIMFNEGFGCKIESHMLGTNIPAWNVSKPASVLIMDRQNDNKYYAYLPSGVSIKTDDYLKTKLSIIWEVH